MLRILWVDDEPWTVRPEVDKLDPLSYNITLVSSASSGFRALKAQLAPDTPKYDLVVVDVILRLAGIGEEPVEEIQDAMSRRLGLHFARAARTSLNVDAPFLFYSVVQDPRSQEYAKALNAQYVLKRRSIAEEINKWAKSKYKE